MRGKEKASLVYKELKKLAFKNLQKLKVSYWSSMIFIPYSYSIFNSFIRRIIVVNCTTHKCK